MQALSVVLAVVPAMFVAWRQVTSCRCSQVIIGGTFPILFVRLRSLLQLKEDRRKCNRLDDHRN